MIVTFGWSMALDWIGCLPTARFAHGKRISELDLEESLNEAGKDAIDALDRRLVGSALPNDLKLGLTTSHGLSIGALIGLLAKKHKVNLPLANWGAGTRPAAPGSRNIPWEDGGGRRRSNGSRVSSVASGKSLWLCSLDRGVRVCDGQGNSATLELLETLAASGLLFAGLADNEGTEPGRWQALKRKLGDRLLQWQDGCTEQHVIAEIANDMLPELLKDADGVHDGDRLRTIAERLGIQDKQLASIEQALVDQGKTLRQLIVAAAMGSKEGALVADEKAWKKHSRHWFKSEEGGRELAQRMVALGAWDAVGPQVLPLLNAILIATGLQAKDKLVI